MSVPLEIFYHSILLCTAPQEGLLSVSKQASIMLCCVIFIVFLSVATIYISALCPLSACLSLSNARKTQEPVLQITPNITHE
jgi:hypothetical protein